MFDSTERAQPPGGDIIMRPGAGQSVMDCWIAVPEGADRAAPPLVAVHGLYRCAEAQARRLAPVAAAQRRIVVAPVFDAARWPRYQQVIRKCRADLALLALMRELEMSGYCRADRFALVGYSGGAQFAHRFAMLFPHLIEHLSLIAAGWYTFPDATAYPYGLGAPSSRMAGWPGTVAANLAVFCALPIRVIVGEQDDLVDENTRTGPGIDRQQGLTRLDRARRWTAAIDETARTLGQQADIRLITVPGCGHDFAGCIADGEARRHLLPQ